MTSNLAFQVGQRWEIHGVFYTVTDVRAGGVKNDCMVTLVDASQTNTVDAHATSLLRDGAKYVGMSATASAPLSNDASGSLLYQHRDDTITLLRELLGAQLQVLYLGSGQGFGGGTYEGMKERILNTFDRAVRKAKGET